MSDFIIIILFFCKRVYLRPLEVCLFFDKISTAFVEEPSVAWNWTRSSVFHFFINIVF